MKLLPVDLSVQLLPGTFEHALSRLIDHELDLRVLDERQAGKIEVEVQKMLERHREADDKPLEPGPAKKEVRRIETDNESPRMATSNGVIQGYTGVAAVDSQCQIIVEAQARGMGSEQALLVPVVEAMRDLFEDDSIVTADAGYHSRRSRCLPTSATIRASVASRYAADRKSTRRGSSTA